MKVDKQIQKHYEIEKKLTDRLKKSTIDERTDLYQSLYNELFNKVSWYPLLIKKEDEKSKELRLKSQFPAIEDYINKESVFMEVGSGDCSFAFDLTKKGEKVYAIDVSDEIVKTKASLPDNLQLFISDGISVGVPTGSVDLSYSNQLIDHLHSDDIAQHWLI